MSCPDSTRPTSRWRRSTVRIWSNPALEMSRASSLEGMAPRLFGLVCLQ